MSNKPGAEADVPTPKIRDYTGTITATADDLIPRSHFNENAEADVPAVPPATKVCKFCEWPQSEHYGEGSICPCCGYEVGFDDDNREPYAWDGTWWSTAHRPPKIVRQLADGPHPSTVVDMPGRPVAAPCCLSGCHYGELEQLRAALAGGAPAVRQELTALSADDQEILDNRQVPSCARQHQVGTAVYLCTRPSGHAGDHRSGKYITWAPSDQRTITP